jgi:hypothetical protein
VAGGVILAAKIIGTGLVARIFLLTKPSLMQIGWFRTAYEKFVPWQEALFARVRNSWIWRYARLLRQRANAFLKRSWAALKPRVESFWADLRERMRAGTPRSVARPSIETRSVDSRRPPPAA